MPFFRFFLLISESGNIKTFSIDEKFQLLSVTNITHSVVCLDYDYKAVNLLKSEQLEEEYKCKQC